MLSKADRDIHQIERFLSSRGLEAGLLVPTETGMEKSIMDAHGQLSSYFCRAGLHDYSLQAKGKDAKVFIKTWIVKSNNLVETKTSLYRPETKLGDPRIWVYDLAKHATPGNLLVLIAHGNELYVINTSESGLLETSSDLSSPLSHLLELLAGSKNKPLTDRFSEWNLRLLRSFFSEASGGEEVFLRVDKDFLDQIGQDIGGDAGFLNAVNNGPSWISSNFNLVELVHELVSERKIRSRNYKDPGDFDLTYRGLHAPAYLPYLAALVRNDSENPNAYYLGLQKDLELNQEFGSSEMARLQVAWSDLQKWTESTRGRFGYFKIRRLGGYTHIGIPRSQSILKPRDIEDLASVFVQAEIKPGQELTEDYLQRALIEARTNKSAFTAAFQKALDIQDFEQPILAAISSAYIDWDGTLPKKTKNSVGEENLPIGTGIGLSLVVLNEVPLELSPRWRLPAIEDSGEFYITHDSFTWRGKFFGSDGGLSYPSDNALIWKIANKAFQDTLHFQIQHGDIDDSEPTKLGLTLRRHKLWIFVPRFDLSSGEIELTEGDLPGSGIAFILSPPSSASSLRAYLEREKPSHNLISAKGIPADWLFCQLIDCSSLTDDQRLLPDGEKSEHPKPRMIRFIGGRSIRRGYSRMYLPYDLPTIEFDAPEDARIVHPEGMNINEIVDDFLVKPTKSAIIKPLKRYRIELRNSRSAAYDLKATDQNGVLLGKAKLRVAGLAGEIVEIGAPFSLDNIGLPATTREGLSGAYIPTYSEGNTSPETNSHNLQIDKLGSPVNSRSIEEHGVAQLFLDAVARSGGFNYGVARDLLQRLILSHGMSDEWVSILFDLRSRGHIEISTTHKGHIARVHPVKPTLYSLPIESNGHQLWALAGTLRLVHWNEIGKNSDAWTVLCEDSTADKLPCWRLLISDEYQAKKVATEIGFQFSERPSISVINWSANLETFTEQTLHNTMESIGGARDSAQRLNASKGLFTATPCGNTTELWKVRDLDTQMDNLFILAHQNQFAFVRDSRWGRWLALNAFARWFSETYQIKGVHPIPVMYDTNRGVIWLPARIGLPTILERVLILCSGAPPELFSLTKVEGQKTERITLFSANTHVEVLDANSFYTDMCDGKWLAYKHVPEYVANLFAEKLGAVLDPI